MTATCDLFGLVVGGFPMAGDLTSSELKDPFARSIKRAVEPPDVWTPRRILALRIFACRRDPLGGNA